MTVHANGRNHAGKEVTSPERLVAAYAGWTVEDLRCGHDCLRKGTEVLLGDSDRKLVDSCDHAASIFNLRALEECRVALRRKGPVGLAATFDMRLGGQSVLLSRALRRVVRS